MPTENSLSVIKLSTKAELRLSKKTTTLLNVRNPGPNAAPKVLLADDSVTMHRAVTLALRKEPIELLTCDNGQDALRLALEHRPAVVLADLDMPGLTGVELCKAIRQEPLLRNTKVVLLCGSFDQVDEARLESAEADGRLWKPFEAHVLIALLSALLKSPVRESADATGNIDDFARHMTEETFSQERKIIESQQKTTPPTAKTMPPVSMTPPKLRIPDPISATIAPGTPTAKAPSPRVEVPQEEYLSETPTAPPISKRPSPEPTYSPREADEFLRSDATSSVNVSTHQATENLWSVDFQPMSAPPSSQTAAPNPFADLGADDSDATLDPIYLRSDLEKVALDAPYNTGVDIESMSEPPPQEGEAPKPTTPPPAVDQWLADSDLARFRAAMNSSMTGSMSGAEAAVPEERLREIIRQEIDDAFRGWLRARLQEKLELVLAEIDRE